MSFEQLSDLEFCRLLTHYLHNTSRIPCIPCIFNVISKHSIVPWKLLILYYIIDGIEIKYTYFIPTVLCCNINYLVNDK